MSRVFSFDLNGQKIDSFGNIVDIEFVNNVQTTRVSGVPEPFRKRNLTIMYVNGENILCAEKFNSNDFSDESWGKDENWIKVSVNEQTGSAAIETIETNEHGFFICDSNLNVAFSVTDEGCKGVGLLNYQEN